MKILKVRKVDEDVSKKLYQIVVKAQRKLKECSEILAGCAPLLQNAISKKESNEIRYYLDLFLPGTLKTIDGQIKAIDKNMKIEI